MRGTAAGGPPCRRRTIGVLVAVLLVLYALVVVFFIESPLLSTSSVGSGVGGGEVGGGGARKLHLAASDASSRHGSVPRPPSPSSRGRNRLSSQFVSGLDLRLLDSPASGALRRPISDALATGARKFSELDLDATPARPSSSGVGGVPPPATKCPQSISLIAAEFLRGRGVVVELPCGLALWSHVTVAATPRPARVVRDGDGGRPIMVSQFVMELQGLKTVDGGEDPPRILHFNPRLRGDWSGRPVIELNTGYRMQWGTAQRCEGRRSRADEETVDGLVKCENWIRDGAEDRSEETKMKTAWWLMNRLVGTKKEVVNFEWPYPFVEGRMFVLTLSAGLEGYHVSVDGRHVTSFPYRTGFVLEDATGLSLNGDLDMHSVFVGSLPIRNTSLAQHSYLEFSISWQAPPLPDGPVEVFIGILSSGNHFAERMGVRKTWMSAVRKSSNVVARFFVALHDRNEVNVDLRKEAEFFRDIVFVPFLDNYDLVVLKLLAICDYGVNVVSAKYIMKCDDDNFVRLDPVVSEINKVPRGRSLYLGNINFNHRPLRHGKWAVSYEEWPEEVYPAYANGPGYVISSDIADFILSEFMKKKLRLFKMEDVSMGLWVEQFNRTRPIEYIHNVKFCQFGCISGYYTAHYQSPRMMLCMWQKLLEGKQECCNVR